MASRSTAPQHQFGVRLLQVPVSEAGDPRAGEYIIDHLSPGAVIHREFQVTDLGSGPLQLSLYPAAASVAHGTFQFAAGRTQNDMTTWVHLSRAMAALSAHQAATITAIVTVPRDAPPGEQYGVIWAEQATKGAGNVTLVSRVGIRLYLSIGSGGAPASAFSLGQPSTSRGPGGTRIVRVLVHNTGGRALDVRGTLQLTGGQSGLQAGPFNTTAVVTVAPGQSYPATFSLSPNIPPGPWQATFTLTSGLLKQTEKATIRFGNGTTTVAHKTRLPLMPIIVGTILALLIAAAVLLIKRSRRAPRSRAIR